MIGLMELETEDFNILYGGENVNTTCENICEKCSCCYVSEYDTAVIGYNDKGERVIVSCSAFRE